MPEGGGAGHGSPGRPFRPCIRQDFQGPADSVRAGAQSPCMAVGVWQGGQENIGLFVGALVWARLRA